ncbi:MAG: radical SAM protein [Lachnospiraceae bacterium]|nr:radical SAM protein [Lachnospiraceae bacterium]
MTEVCGKEQYYDYLQEQIEFLKKNDLPIVLYGTLEMAYYAKLGLQKMNKLVAAYCDSKMELSGTEKEGKKVFSVEELQRTYPQALIVICSFNEKNVRIIAENLKNYGYEKCVNGCVLYYYYQMKVMRRPVDAKLFAETIYMQQHKNDYVVVGKAPGNLAVVITEKCNLRCRDCGVMIPYYEHPKHYDKDFIIQSIRSMAESVDLIETLNIIGGETFLHPDLADICEEAAKLPNIFTVMIVTNGAVKGNASLWKRLSYCVNNIVVSNYDKYSCYKDFIYANAIKNNIYCVMFSNDIKWYKFYPPKKQNRTLEENQRIFQDCFCVYCAEKIINGEFHLCDFSAAVAPFGILKEKNDFMCLMDENLTAEDKKEKVKKLLYETKTIEACDYCRFYLKEETEKAVQVEGVLRIQGD